MKIEDLKDFLNAVGVKYEEEPIQHGRRVRGPDGELFSVFESRKFVRQGKSTTLAESVEKWAKQSDTAPSGRSAISRARLHRLRTRYCCSGQPR